MQDCNERAKSQNPSAISHFVTHLPNRVIGPFKPQSLKKRNKCYTLLLFW